MYNEGFMLLPAYPDLHKTVQLQNVVIHVVGDRRDFSWERARDPKSGIAAYANSKGEIWILGRMSDGKIMVNWVVLGHEMSHLMNFSDSDMINPDENK